LPVTERCSNKLGYLLNLKTEEYSVYNIAVSGYNMKQMIEAGTYLSSFIKPRIIIVGLYLGGLDRLQDPYVFHKGFAVRSSRLKYVKIKNDKLVFTHAENKILKNLESFFIVHSVLYNLIANNIHKLKHFFVGSYDSDCSLAFYKVDKMLLKLKLDCDDENIKLILLPILQHDENMKFYKNDLILYEELKSICNENEIIFADILPKMKRAIAMGNSFFIKKDRHWNEEAHQIAAQSLHLIIDKL
jgi:hypothetical protein